MSVGNKDFIIGVMTLSILSIPSSLKSFPRLMQYPIPDETSSISDRSSEYSFTDVDNGGLLNSINKHLDEYLLDGIGLTY